MNELRAVDAKAKSAWYAGETDAPPHGLSSLRYLLPKELSSDCRDVADLRFSEWGNAAGFDL